MTCSPIGTASRPIGVGQCGIRRACLTYRRILRTGRPVFLACLTIFGPTCPIFGARITVFGARITILTGRASSNLSYRNSKRISVKPRSRSHRDQLCVLEFLEYQLVGGYDEKGFILQPNQTRGIYPVMMTVSCEGDGTVAEGTNSSLTLDLVVELWSQGFARSIGDTDPPSDLVDRKVRSIQLQGHESEGDVYGECNPSEHETPGLSSRY